VTIVVGFDWLTETVMIADTRVSWENNQFPPKDILRKLYTLGDSKKSAVLGFSGDLHAAKKVMTFLIKQKFLGYKRPFVIRQFRDDLHQWIEEIALAKLTPKQRKELSFMLCGIEPSRRPSILEDGKITGYTPFTESHIYVYTIGENGNVRVNKRPKGFAIIGTGRKLRKAVIEQIQETIHFGFNDPKLHWARAALINEIVASLAKENKAVSTVGGPFQVIRITPDGLKTDYTWPPDVDSKNVEIRIEGSKTIIHNPASGESYVLHPIWDSPF